MRKTAGPATSASRSRRESTRGGSSEPRHHRDHPHRREQGAALKGAAGRVGADPEDMQADQRADGRQHLRQENHRPIGLAPPERRRRSAPGLVGAHRPNPEHREDQHDLLEHGVERAIGDQHGGDGVAEPGAGAVGGGRGLRREARGGLGQHQDDRRERAGDQHGQQPAASHCSARPGGASGFRHTSSASEPSARRDQQDAGDAAADGRLGQGDVRRVKPDPDQSEQAARRRHSRRRRRTGLRAAMVQAARPRTSKARPTSRTGRTLIFGLDEARGRSIAPSRRPTAARAPR